MKGRNLRGRSVKRMISAALLLMVLVVCTACSDAPRLRDFETQVYTNEAAGYHITLPAEWQLASEEPESTIFLSADGATSLTLFNELGGEAYYTLQEISEMLLSGLAGGTETWKVERNLVDNKKELRQYVKGQDEEGAGLFVDLYIVQPYAGIRYYLLFAGGEMDYNNQSSLFGDMIKSFTVDDSQEDLYHEMQNRREEAE